MSECACVVVLVVVGCQLRCVDPDSQKNLLELCATNKSYLEVERRFIFPWLGHGVQGKGEWGVEGERCVSGEWRGGDVCVSEWGSGGRAMCV